MREIKFRAWNKVKKNMYTDAINNCQDSFDLILKHPQVYEVMQYTGLKDRDGVKIYEGDIYTMGDRNILYQVVYRDTGFIGKQLRSSSYAGLSHWHKKIEIIGNIYENPNLINKR